MVEDLIHRISMPNEARCSVSEYMNGDDDLPTCSEEGDETWEEEFFASDQHPLEEEEPDDVSFDLEPPPSKIRNFCEAIHSLEDVKPFLMLKDTASKQQWLLLL